VTGHTGFAYDPVFLQHFAGHGHPECKERLEAIVELLETTKLMDQLVALPAPELEPRWLEEVHRAGYPGLVRDICAGTTGVVELPTGDAPVCPVTYEVALRAAGACVAACDAILAGDVRNAFCAVRPPGHHARHYGGMGFCVFNNVAVAARYLQKHHGLEKIAILDWDVHHGNGTQDAFYEDPTVLFCSTHLWPFYPGTGQGGETGRGQGEGFTINVPMSHGDGDDEILTAFDETFRAAVDDFEPDFVLLSAGYDAHHEDLLGGMTVTDEGFQRLATIVREFADTHCDGRLLATLEGGYTVETLARNVGDTLNVFRQ